MIPISRAGSNLGIFSEEDVREGLGSGRFAGTDLGWREGMANWQPLSQFPEFSAAGTPAPPPSVAPGLPAATTSVAPARSGLPWDSRHTRGFFQAFIDTLTMVLTRPGEAFTAMKREGGLAEPLIYGVIGSSAGFIVYWLFVMILPSAAMFGGGDRNPLAHMVGAGFMGIFIIILAPLLVTVGLFIQSAILHLCLMIVGGAKQPFETTFRVICFSSGSVGPLIMIPFCGSIVACVWQIVLHCIGLARAHETDTGRAVLAVFLPLIVCCGGGFLLAIIFGGISALHSSH
jgi:hypothetical protein